MAGCVVSQGKAFHDNTSVLRFGLFTVAVKAFACVLLLWTITVAHVRTTAAAEVASQWTLLMQFSATTSSLQSVCLYDLLL